MGESRAEESLRFPIGRFVRPAEPPNKAERERIVARIEDLPGRLRQLVLGLDRSQLDTPYRDGGWTLRQVVHHVADAHVHGYTRFKQALTLDRPEVPEYLEDAYAALPDSREGPIAFSLDLLAALNARWVWLLRRLDENAWSRELVPPPGPAGPPAPIDLRRFAALYAWHGDHHAAHVEGLLVRKGWR